jgi:hypothetical protein
MFICERLSLKCVLQNGKLTPRGRKDEKSTTQEQKKLPIIRVSKKNIRRKKTPLPTVAFFNKGIYILLSK